MKRSLALLICGVVLAITAISQSQPDRKEQFKIRSRQAEAKGLAEPFKGFTTNGTPTPGLFGIESTGVSTAGAVKTASVFLSALTPEQKQKTAFDVDDDEWRKWMNQHFYDRQGMSFKDMSEAQRESAFGLLRASLSAKGLKLTRDIMRLNHTLGELNNNNFEEYGEWLYWITVMGTPSATEPWGWQLDGHHLIINYFVLGDQVVMTPTFWGSEPVIARSGKFNGTTILQDEQTNGLKLINMLDEAQRKKAIIQVSKTGNNNVGEAFKDNVVLDYAGIRATELTPAQKRQLFAIANDYISNMKEGHAKVKMEEIQKHIHNTYFAWIGGTAPNSVFYYRIHSPVIMIEFDHQLPVGLRQVVENPKAPNREHVHAVVRTPNGNDYGKDLLKQHYQKHPHPHSH